MLTVNLLAFDSISILLELMPSMQSTDPPPVSDLATSDGKDIQIYIIPLISSVET